MLPEDLPDDLDEFFRLLCAASARETLPRFRVRIDVDNKEKGGFDPVTEADRAAEAAIRAEIGRRFPDHGILGEEHEPVNPDAEFVWHIDPVDGTRAFICGLPSWGTLIGLARRGVPAAGLMHQPFTGETYLATGRGSFLEARGARTRLATSAVTRLADAKLMTTTPKLFSGGDLARYGALEAAVRLPRYGFDCYAYAMLAAGHVDLVVETGLKSYDIVPLIPVIAQAGGVVTDWEGAVPLEGGRVVAAANAELHARALQILAG